MTQQHSNMPMRPEHLQADLILDTNVLLEIFSVHDIEDLGTAPDPKKLAYRRARARDSLLFAWLCHERGLVTASLKMEAYERLVENVPPGEDGPLRVAYTKVFIWYVRDHVLSGWHPGFLAAVDDSGMSGAARDNAYLEATRADGLSLITNEGNGLMGPRPTDNRGRLNLRGRAEAAGGSPSTRQVSSGEPADWMMT